MASRYYGLNRGQTEQNVAEGSSTNSTDLEVVFDLTKNLTKSEILVLLEMIKNHIIKGNFPPA